MKISIIIPVYNTQEFLRRCVDSLVAQTHKNIEIILIDDGSTDGSLALAKELALGDSRIIVLHQQNAGVSAARNNGLAHATGDYIAFADSDDWVEEDYYEGLLKAAQNGTADLVISGYKLQDLKGDFKPITPLLDDGADEQRLDNRGLLEWVAHSIMYVRYSTINTVWNKLIARNVIFDTQSVPAKPAISFDTAFSVGEDFLFLLNIYEKAQNAVLSGQKGYFYRYNQNSVYRSASRFLPQNLTNEFHLDTLIYDLCSRHKLPIKTSYVYSARKLSHTAYHIANTPQTPDFSPIETLKHIYPQFKWRLIRYTHGGRYIAVLILFGLRLYRPLIAFLRLYKRIIYGV